MFCIGKPFVAPGLAWPGLECFWKSGPIREILKVIHVACSAENTHTHTHHSNHHFFKENLVASLILLLHLQGGPAKVKPLTFC